MSNTPNRATLQGGSIQGPIMLGPEGWIIELDIPPGILLEHGELTIEAPDDSLTLEVKPTITTSDKSNGVKNAVDWISADWGVRRPIMSLEIKASPATKAFLKVSEGGPWYPPMPFDKIALNEKIQLSGVTGTRLLVEPLDVKSTGDKPIKGPATIELKELEVAARPPDIMVSIGDSAPFFHYPLLLDPKQVLVLRDELTAALQRAWPADLRGGKITMNLRSSADSRLQNVKLEFDTCLVIRTWEHQRKTATLRLEAGQQESIHLPDFAGEKPQSLVFSV